MLCHDFDFCHWSLQILILLVFWRGQNLAFGWFLLVFIAFGESWISRFWRVIGPIDFNDFQVSDFCLFYCPFLMISVFWGGLNEWEFDSHYGFISKVDSHDRRSWRHLFGGSPRTKIMKLHDFNFALFSLIILRIPWFWSHIFRVKTVKSLKSY